MKHAAWIAAALAVLSSVGVAGAAESAADTETDHVDAVDEGGPRFARLALQPVSPGLGLGQVEASVALTEHLAVSGALAWILAAGGPGYRASAGVPLFPCSTVFHGLYVHPRAEWTRTASASSLAVAATVGYAWTWPFGATSSLGAGLAFTPVTSRFEPCLDAAVGWLF
jgi:hypothetical protein